MVSQRIAGPCAGVTACQYSLSVSLSLFLSLSLSLSIGRSPVSYPYVQYPFPSKRGGILERDDLGSPVVPGEQNF